MNQRSRLLIYERKEVVLLGFLSLLVAVFAFTFGIHLGKRVPPKTKPVPVDGSPVGQVNQISDQAPTRAEARDKVAEAQTATAQILDETLKEEVSVAGLQLKKPVQIDLPRETVSEKKVNKNAAPQLKSALARSTPAGAFTVQILSAPITDSVKMNRELARFRASGLEPWAREVEIPGKGRWIRLYQGAFASRQIAEQSASGWKLDGKIDSYVISKISGHQETSSEKPSQAGARDE